MTIRQVFIAALVTGIFATAAPIRTGTDSFELEYRVKLPATDHPARLWLPLAKTDAFQQVTIRQKISANAIVKTDSVYSNDILMTELQPSAEATEVVIAYSVRRQEKTEHAVTEPFTPELWTRAQALVPKAEVFRETAVAVTAGIDDELARGRALYDHVLEHMSYDKSGTGWGNDDAVYACNSAAGNCTDFHAYFIALTRAIDIPARFAIGFTIPPDSDVGKIGGYHCWAEFVADGKWIPVDISEGWKHPELKAYYFGHHPANRLELSIGRDIVVDPLPASGPFNYLVYPLLQVGDELVAIEHEFSFKRLGN